MDYSISFCSAHNELAGKTVANKVLVFPSGKASSVVQIDGLLKRARVSAFIVKVPLMDKLEKDPFENIHTCDFPEVDADKGTVTIRRRKR